ncbi:MAG TPA: hypothetical protein VFR18_26095 [Terriglobia bacterium]|nr:hypothetical protein [Terriglobia bacterium]
MHERRNLKFRRAESAGWQSLGRRRSFEHSLGKGSVEYVDDGFEHHEEVEEIEAIRVIVTMVEVENRVGRIKHS